MADESLLVKILEEIKLMRNDISDLKTDVTELKMDVSELKSRQQEDHQILKALEHKADVNKAEYDKMTMDISQIQGYQKNISESIDAIKEIIGRHEVDITVLKRRPV
ncbi:hypothetical protein [Lutispora sp.]|uniref:hypothetical protein n=1 Tax=Lutispora sp. TaxID=2828727 RepID=UPI002B20FA3D|nr:hypothetical protein [Lutispora sp.]MEA4963321.1 hypothetical protein [Lutispora sp.]